MFNWSPCHPPALQVTRITPPWLQGIEINPFVGKTEESKGGQSLFRECSLFVGDSKLCQMKEKGFIVHRSYNL